MDVMGGGWGRARLKGRLRDGGAGAVAGGVGGGGVVLRELRERSVETGFWGELWDVHFFRSLHKRCATGTRTYLVKLSMLPLGHTISAVSHSIFNHCSSNHFTAEYHLR